MSENEQLPLKRAGRIQRTIELSVMGLPVWDIENRMKEEGYRTSNITIRRDMDSPYAENFKQELLRKQLADISLCPDYDIKLRYRAHLLDKFFPTKISQELTENVKPKDADLQTLTPEQRDYVTRAVEALHPKQSLNGAKQP